VLEPAAARRARFACYVNIAGCHLQLHGRSAFGRAARACRQAIALEPSSVLAHFRLAQALAAAGGSGANFEEALKFYKRALRFCRAEAKAAAAKQQPQQQKAKAWCAEIKAAIGQCEFQRNKHRMPPAPAPAATAATVATEEADASTAVVVETGKG
jgi:tetratricopeptide (TPR) repeat protein